MPELNEDCHCTVQHYHGTRQCYRTCGCRRQECREADAAARREAQNKRDAGKSTTHPVDAAPVRKHLEKLIESGWGTRAISEMTGVNVSALVRTVYGINGVPQVHVRADSAEKLLAFNPPPRHKFDGTSIETTDATGSRRRLQALVALGFSLNVLADYAGYSRSYFKDLTKKDRISVQRAVAVTDLYEKLWNRKPLPETKEQRHSVIMAKKAALAKGWLPPMAWDDAGIDNPDYQPYAKSRRLPRWH